MPATAAANYAQLLRSPGCPTVSVLLRAACAQGPDGDVGGDFAGKLEDQPPGLGDMANSREIQFPFLEDAARLGFAAGAEHHQHALLAFAQHDLVGAHAGFAHRYEVEVEFDAEPAFAGHLDGGGGEARSTHVLDRDDRVARHELDACPP